MCHVKCSAVVGSTRVRMLLEVLHILPVVSPISPSIRSVCIHTTFAFFFLFYGTSIILSLYRVHVGFHVLPVDALVLMHIVLRARFPSTQ